MWPIRLNNQPDGPICLYIVKIPVSLNFSRFFAYILLLFSQNFIDMKVKLSALSLIVPVFFLACKKDNSDVMVTPAATTPIDSINTDNLLKDSVLLNSRDVYLWNTQIPASFNPRTYADPNEIMEAIRTYSIEPGFTQPVDRYSFAIKKAEWDNLSMGMSAVGSALDNNGDNGLTVFFRTEGDLRVRLVEPNSPAGIAGIHRGWRITRINSNSNITTSNSNFIVDNIYNATNVSLTLQKPDGSLVNISLAQSHYATKPVYLDTVYTINNKKIGYLVFNSFLGNVDQLYSEFQRVFLKFSAAGIEEVIIDLRYNGGGYVSVQERLANYLANNAANGGVMMKQEYNQANSAANETTLFKKAGSLNLSRVYFIVGRSTASASELLINNLKPYMDVQLVGGTTYGKPVGFFPIPAGDWYIFPISFRTVNKNGAGNYFNGIAVNNTVADGLDKDWGDLSENSLAGVVRKISSGAYRMPAQPDYVEPLAVATGNKSLEASLLKLTIGTAPVSSHK